MKRENCSVLGRGLKVANDGDDVTDDGRKLQICTAATGNAR